MTKPEHIVDPQQRDTVIARSSVAKMNPRDRRQSRQSVRHPEQPAKGSADPTINPHIAADQSEILDFLSQQETYGISADPIRIDTHAAVVFLAGSFAYKMKRAVRFPFLDFSTLERRRLICEAEIELNRPNAPELYVDTVPIVRRDGVLKLGGTGTIVEWLVRMRRFDPSDTLDHVADRGELTETILAKLVDAIADLHKCAPVCDGDAATQRLGLWMRGNVDELREAPNVIAREQVDRLGQNSEAEYLRVTDLLLARGRAGYVRRCHGDLHLRNIAVIDGQPTLFDALEFDQTFATHDVFYDLAFLLMDLWQRGLHSMANHVLNRYLWRNGALEHIDGCALFPLFMSIRAAIRAKVAISTAPFENPEGAEIDIDEARNNFAFADRFLLPIRPYLVAIGGLSGTGKTSVSSLLAAELGRPPGALHLRSDIERKRLFNVADTDRLPLSAYAQDMSDVVYARVRDKASRAIRAGHSVIVDAVHAQPAEREAIEAVAHESNAPFIGIWLEAPDDILVKRVTARVGDASDADARVTRLQLALDAGPMHWRRVDASQGTDTVGRQILNIVHAD